MKKVIATLLMFLFAFSLSFCSKKDRVQTSVKSVGSVAIPSVSPDMVIQNFKFREISQRGVDADFTARRAHYFRAVDFVSFIDVEGVFKGDEVPYHFRLQEAMYDSGIRSLVSTGKVLITASDVFRLTGYGGIFDFERHEASLERDVVLRSGSISVTGEKGVLDFKNENFRLEKVQAFISDLEGFHDELKEVVK